MKPARKITVSIVGVFTAFSIAVNAASPSYITNLFSQKTIEALIESQGILQVYSQVSQIPICIAGMLTGSTEIVKFAAKKQDPANGNVPDKKQQKTNDLSFSQSQSLANMLRPNSSVVSTAVYTDDVLGSIHNGHSPGQMPDGRRTLIIIMYMLMFIVQLRRSSLPAPNRHLSTFDNITRSSQKRIGFFISGGLQNEIRTIG